MWGLVKAYVNAKERDIVASKFVDIALDNGTSEDDLKELIGMDDELDTAVRDILELEDDSNEEDEYDYGDSDSDDY